MITDCINNAAFDATTLATTALVGVQTSDVDVHHLAAVEGVAYEATLFACDVDDRPSQ
jgi:hypothetical protein